MSRLAALSLLIVLAACSTQAPPTIQASALRSVWQVFIPAGIGVYAIVGGLIVWSAVAYRRRDPRVRQAATFHENRRLEILWTVVPILIVIGLFIKTFVVEKQVERVVARPAEIVSVTGFRWSWRFAYPQHDVAVIGTEKAPPVLTLPVGRTIQINLTSSDVVHSFWIPAFMFKRDANPGMMNVFDFDPTRIGVYTGTCAEYCGTYHANMAFSVHVVSQADYERWLRQHGGKT